MENKELKIAFNAPLCELDSENQTYGCRANNPNICSFCYMTDVCAFASADQVCKKPSRAWRKQFIILKEKGNG